VSWPVVGRAPDVVELGTLAVGPARCLERPLRLVGEWAGIC